VTERREFERGRGINVDDVTPQPRRLAEDPGALGALLARARVELQAGVDEPRAWQRLSARWAFRAPWPALLVRRTAMGMALAAVVWLAAGLVHNGRQDDRLGPRVRDETAAAPAPTSTSAAPKVVTLGAAAVELGAGQYELPDGVQVAVREKSGARAARTIRRTRVALDWGTVELSVEHQPQARTVEVTAGGYRFVVVGTRFAVDLDGGSVSLDVSKGRVAVWRAQSLVASVGAGQRWQGERRAPSDDTDVDAAAPAPAEAAPDAATARASSVASGSREADCLKLARAGQPRQAERCYEQKAAGNALGAEVALYELGRLRADVLGDLSGALRALSEHRRRFPGGTLASEAELARLDVLTGLGRQDEVLRESGRLLGARVGAERGLELRLLRGKIYRSRGDAARAEAEYAVAAQNPTAAGAEASYQRARCLDELGRASEAAAEYQRYLLRNHAVHRKDAARRLEELSQ
jgi:tetratricopeptide (TPR) repeat protein